MHVLRADALLLELDVVVDHDVRHHALQHVRGEEAARANSVEAWVNKVSALALMSFYLPPNPKTKEVGSCGSNVFKG